MSLDAYIVIEYIKSSVDIILNLKFEEIEKRLIEKTDIPSTKREINTFARKRASEARQNKDLNEEPSIRNN
jgi:hypothetical protein